jgi:cyclic pyranopterin monophosphate synthase
MQPMNAQPGDPRDAALSHVQRGPQGSEARMVDVGGKTSSRRTASARALLRFPAGILERVLAGSGPKGAVQEVARVAGILAAKRTPDWIPMCHSLALDHVAIRFESLGADLLAVHCEVACSGPTGVEMEALVGASAAALTVYDMSKALSKGIVIERVELLEKTGGKSGDWRRETP